MKLIITLFAIFFTINLSTCQESSAVPAVVQQAWEAKYPNENDPDWEIDSNGNYESHFKKKGVKYRADFSPKGYWIETETNITETDLPIAIRQRLDAEYSDLKITEIEKVEHYTKGLFYDVEFKRKGKNKDVEFDASGNILNGH